MNKDLWIIPGEWCGRSRRAETAAGISYLRVSELKGLHMKRFLIDANKDGVVTMEELQAARKARAGQRRGAGSSPQPARPA